MRIWKPLLIVLVAVPAIFAAAQVYALVQSSSWVREPVRLGPPQVSGPCRAGADWMSADEPQAGLKIASYELQLKKNEKYLIEMELSRLDIREVINTRPALIVDLYAPGYDFAEQERAVLLPGHKTRMRVTEIIPTLDSPKRGHLRILTAAHARVLVSGIRVYRLKSAAPLWTAGFVLLAFAGCLAGIAAAYRRSPDLAATLLVGGIALFASALTKPFESYDTLWNVPVALSILSEGNTDLNEYRGLIHRRNWGATLAEGKWYNFYPVGMSVLAVPVVFGLHPFAGDDLQRLEVLSARCFFAAVSCLFYVFLRTRRVPRPRAILWTLLFSFTTSNLTVLSGALWTHTGIQFLLITGLTLLVRAEETRDADQLALAALPIGMLYTVRPNSAILILCLTAYVCWTYRREAIRYLSVLALVLGAFFLWSLSSFGTALPAYYRMRLNPEPAAFVCNLAGLLVSPNRGLLIFTPLVLFSIIGLGVTAKRGTRLDQSLAVGMVISLLTLACWPYWWGGESYGPRLLTDLNPVLALFALEGFTREEQQRPKTALVSLTLAALLGLLVQVRGATSDAASEWNKFAVHRAGVVTHVDRRPERLWDWKDLQVLRGLYPPASQ